MRLPTFVILGAPRAGTTALYKYLNQHPQIYMSPNKEPQFFALGEMDLQHFRGPLAASLDQIVVSSLADYQSLFAPVADPIAIGEASMTNLLPRAAERIKDYVPNAQLIAILRQPAERAYSQFLHARWMGWEPLADFAQAVEQEEWRQQQGWTPFLCYQQRGFYCQLLQPFFANFPRQQVHIYFYEDWLHSPLKILHELFQVLGVDPAFAPNVTKKYNSSKSPKNVALWRFLRQTHWLKSWLRPFVPLRVQRSLQFRLNRYNVQRPPPLAPDLKRQLTRSYQNDILGLQELVGSDLRHWLD